MTSARAHAPLSSSSFRSSLFADPQQTARQEAFRSLKPGCTLLLTCSLLTPENIPSAIKSLSQIHHILFTLPSPAETLTPSLTSYVFFPITQLLQRNPPRSVPPPIRIGVLRVLTVLVRYWSGEGRAAVREQIWKMAVSWWKVGGLDTEEGIDAWIQGLREFALGSSSGETELDFEREEAQLASQLELEGLVAREAFLPVLGETLHIMIRIISTTPIPLRILQTFHAILRTYLPNRSRIKATILPGCVSTLTKLLSPLSSRQSGKGVNGDIVVESLGIITHLVTGCFSLAIVGPIIGHGAQTLNDFSHRRVWLTEEELASTSGSEEPLPTSTPSPPSPASSDASFKTTTSEQTGTSFTSTQSVAASPLVTITSSWLRGNASQLLPAFISLSHLKKHSNPNARNALADLSSTLLLTCLDPLEESVHVLLGYLLTLSVDTFPAVNRSSRQALISLLDIPGNRPKLIPILNQALTTSLQTIPLLLQSPQQVSSVKVTEHCQQITAVAQLGPTSESLLQGMLGPIGGVERWGTGLLDCMVFEPDVVMGSSYQRPVNRIAELAWTATKSSTVDPSLDGKLDDVPYPRICLSNLANAETEDAFAGMLVSLGRAAGEEAIFAVEHFIAVAKAGASDGTVIGLRRSVAGVWVAERLLRGIVSSLNNSDDPIKGIEKTKTGVDKGRRTRKTIRRLVKTLMRMDADQQDEDPTADNPTNSSGGTEEKNLRADRNLTDMVLKPEYIRGLNPLTTLLDQPSHNSSTNPGSGSRTSAADRLISQSILSCHSLSLLAFSAQTLTTSFRPLLLDTTYYLLAHLGSPSVLVQQYASIALDRIAYESGYASARNLVFDNVDYVINVVSQRLTSTKLDALAPLVLIEMIRLVGEPIVPMVHDVVDEIFDALDAFHGYELVASTLLAVLDTLIKVMPDGRRDDARSRTMGPGDQGATVGEKMYPDRPQPEKDLHSFRSWLAQRHDQARSNLEELLEETIEPTPHQSWGRDKSLPSVEADEASTSLPPTDGPLDVEPDRSQSICAQIISQALPFLTHASPFLRSRVLSLFASAIGVLAPAGLEAQLLPVVNRAWPYILNRTKDKEYYVVVEAVGVIECLSKLVGEYVGVKIRDEGWPVLKQLAADLLKDQRKDSLITRRGNTATAINTGRQPQSKHTPTHRLLRSLLSTFRHVAVSVPLTFKQRWDMLLLVRAFLDDRTHEELRTEANLVYLTLGWADEDAVWAGLRGSLNWAENDKSSKTERMGWLVEDDSDLKEGISKILQKLEEAY
ncbi:Uncharacterized conserved protein [Phaffia rhodozyma]|uniref:Uncharacterized conserved protein n=1 Tax=Phaffia rhodozyma TaxID=264483 RepID=A0A0F7SJR4_PHARH|nr:Uncharacterized conserved protein [Phaffia rhodozyma]